MRQLVKVADMFAETLNETFLFFKSVEEENIDGRALSGGRPGFDGYKIFYQHFRADIDLYNSSNNRFSFARLTHLWK